MSFLTLTLLSLPLAPLASLPGRASLGSATSVRADELSELLEAQLEEVEDLPVDAIWDRARELAVVVGDEYGAAFDAALERALDGGSLSGRGTLFLASARLLGDDVDYEALIDWTSPLIESSDDALIVGAATLLGGPQIQRLDPDVREKLADALLAVTRSGQRSPLVRIECAVSAHRVGLGDQIHEARRHLFDFMKSSDSELVAKGALALARLSLIDNVDGVEEELERLATLPGEDGRLADAYLSKQRLRRLMETRLRRERERSSSMLDRGISGGPPDLERIGRVIELVQQAHLEGDHATRDQLIEAALRGMLRSLDQHSSFFSSEEFKKFEQDLEAEYGGIGAYVQNDPHDNLFTITRPIYSGPAYRGGLGTDDKIVQIDDWPTIGKDVDDIIKQLKGRPGTKVKLYVWRRGMDPSLIDRPTEEMSVTLERDRIVIPPVHSEYLPGDIGLVDLTTFSRVASKELKQDIEGLERRGMKALILDLRNNTGGLLSEARNVADLFLPPGEVVVKTQSRVNDTQEYRTRGGSVIPADMPVVVLINRFSASAAEIVSGALQDQGRAILVGQRSFGKGSVQNLFRAPGEQDDEYADENGNHRWDTWEAITRDFNGNGEFDYAPRVKLTIERYLLPSGRSIHRELDEEGNVLSPGGVEPDREVAARRWEQWRLEELVRLQGEGTIRDWVNARFPQNRELFARLAEGDLDDTRAYPGFDELYASLDTVLPPADVRFMVRSEVRRFVQDVRGEAFPFGGDYQEDLQLQEAIRVCLEALGTSVDAIEPYRITFDEVDPDAKSMAAPVALSGERDSARLDAALSLIAEAQGSDGHISAEGLTQLTELLRELGSKN